ncbi:uncharacterized protein [Panulirus ornatus]|uniref:uncharacterized protein n=1 Tax=Panulirus ornatus TaxID=150431 RepID=UPI003A8B0689
MMPGETLEEAPGGEGVLPPPPAPHHQMNGCATIPYLPSALEALAARHGNCRAPGMAPVHCEYGRSESTGVEEGVTSNGEAPPSFWRGESVSQDFCVNGVVERQGERSPFLLDTLLTPLQEVSMTEPLLASADGRREPVEEDITDAGSCHTTMTSLSSGSYCMTSMTGSTATPSMNGEVGGNPGEAGRVLAGETPAAALRGTGEAGSCQEEEEEAAAGMFTRQPPGPGAGGSSPAEAINPTRTTAAEEDTTSELESSDTEEEEEEEESFHHEPHDMYFDLKEAQFNVNKSSVVIGPMSVFDVSAPSESNPIPGVEVTSAEAGDGSGQQQQQRNKSSPALHINITTPPVQSLPELRSHSPLLQTQSEPMSPTSTTPSAPRPGAHRHTQALPIPNPMTPQTAMGMTLSPSGTGAICIEKGGSMVLGTQIVINHGCKKEHKHPLESMPQPNSGLESLLTEVQKKLSTVYIRQTKTSFLPWLKGHQVIPLEDFYTECRILAVDKQGRPTRQRVNLVHDLVQEEEETRFLVEGEPGMGKTLLALKLAVDWANKKTLQEFKFVFLIFLRDFKGSLEQYVKEELLPSHFEEKFKQVWEYCKKNEKQVLFILDGYDELEKADEGDIQKLLGNRDFQNSKVVVTARPDVLKTIAQRTIVNGFGEVQMFEFISKYSKLVNEDECGRNLKRIIEKDYKYRKLAERPLFCVLLCMLNGTDGVAKLPEKLTDMMFKIMLCLIKWNIKKVGSVDENTEDFPPKYKELFLSFGKLCLEALKTEKTRFSGKEIRGIENSDLLLHLGFLSNDSENDVLGHKMFWKPVHKIFLEYLAGLYMASHIERDKNDCRECREFSKVYRHEHVLKFVVGILGKRAHLALNGRRHPIFLQMKDQELLMLLRETEPTEENCKAVAKLLDRRNAIVQTSEVDFEGWSFILQKLEKLKSLEIVWRIKSNNPDQESSFNEASPQLYTAFFSALKSNTSITKISIRATQDGEPFSDEKIELFFSHLQGILPKKKLKELEIKELKMKVSYHLRKAVEGATRHMDKKALEDLEILHLDMDMQDEDLEVLCDRLKRCAPKLKELQLTGLVHGPAGFKSLVELLKKNRNLHKLCVSMNKAPLMAKTGVFQSRVHFTPSDLYTSLVGMAWQAKRKSKDAFKKQECDQRNQPALPNHYPTQELKYLFQDHLQTGVQYQVRARYHYFISGDGESRLPLPMCISKHHESMFHKLFSALPESSLQSLTLDYPWLYLNTGDLICLGDAIRKARHLTTLKLIDLKQAEDYMPILIGLGQSQSLTTVKLDSHTVVMKDTAFQLACTALRNNTTLRSLSLAHWEFQLQDKAMAILYFKDLLSSWKVIDLNLSKCVIDVSSGMSKAPTILPPILLPIHAPVQHWSNIKMLRLSEVKLKEQPGFLRRAHLLLPILRNCPNLQNLDLSAPHTQPVTLDDNASCWFFELLGTNFRKLEELTLVNWEFKFEHYEKTCHEIGNMVRSCSVLKVLKLDKVREVRLKLSRPLPCRITFLHQLVSNLPRLSELSLCYYRINNAELDHDTATHVGTCFHNHWSSVTKFKVKFFGLSSDVEVALYEALKKENVAVVVSQDYPLIFTVKRGYFLRT